MKRSESTRSDHGRITLPATVRAALRAKPGDRLIHNQDTTGKVHDRVKADFGSKQARRNGDLSRLPTIIVASRSRMTDAIQDDPIGWFRVVDDGRTKSG